MISKEKMQFIERFNRLQSVKEFEERLKDQPLYEDELAELGYDVVVLDNLQKPVHLGGKPNYLNSKVKYIWGDVCPSGGPNGEKRLRSFDSGGPDTLFGHPPGRVG